MKVENFIGTKFFYLLIKLYIDFLILQGRKIDRERERERERDARRKIREIDGGK
jgi:hypothetical protein